MGGPLVMLQYGDSFLREHLKELLEEAMPEPKKLEMRDKNQSLALMTVSLEQMDYSKIHIAHPKGTKFHFNGGIHS